MTILIEFDQEKKAIVKLGADGVIDPTDMCFVLHGALGVAMGYLGQAAPVISQPDKKIIQG